MGHSNYNASTSSAQSGGRNTVTDDNGGHESWDYPSPKLAKASAIKFDSIHGVLPFDGVRNPGFRSSTSITAWFTYKTAANDGQPKVAICESASGGDWPIDLYLIKTDNANKVRSKAVVGRLLGMSTNYTAVRSHALAEKPYVERLFRTIESALLKQTHGDTGQNSGEFPEKLRPVTRYINRFSWSL
ncbi:hypothetical protein C1J03_18710 [Sulfitobacter sp. SK012]|uniref:hypothetical protein n=1 Tax=Sulfitobacter sp. SK012 TaxID=1389005 RepID=UPI000E0C2431|nr:hypothetical protein [Sulfitobacter sp. SK012]AXI47860.1 hypothetical protein C1J03_18710 [Sulfitobacter sp. SK012]